MKHPVVTLHLLIINNNFKMQHLVNMHFWFNAWFVILLLVVFGVNSSMKVDLLAVSQMHPVSLKNQEWPIHSATYLPKWSWRLINTCNPFLCRLSKWDFKSSAKPHASRCVRGSSGRKERGDRDFLSKPPRNWCYFTPYELNSTMWCVADASCPFESGDGFTRASSPAVVESYTVW